MIDIISVAVQATLILASAFAIVRLAGSARAAVRHGVLATAFVSLLLLPLAGRALSSRAVSVPVPIAATQQIPLDTFLQGEVRVPASVASRAAARQPVDWLTVASNVYLTGVTLLLVSLAVGVWRLRRWATRSEMWVEGATIAAEIARDNGIRRAVLVVVSRDVPVPLTFGFRRQTIVMPAAAKEWHPEAVRRAIRHELEHVRRDDWAMQLVARIACAMYWPHPMVWVALRRFCVEAERTCDDAVVRAADASTYADQLVTLARAVRHRAAVPALAMASPSRLSERVHAVLDPAQPRGPQSRGMLMATLSVMVALVTTFASVRLVAATREAVAQSVEEGVEGAFSDADAPRDAIIRAAARGDVTTLAWFFDRGVNIDKAYIGDGTALLIAARNGRTDAVRWLLDRGADPNAPSPGDGNPLIAAARRGHVDVLELLLDRGARIDEVVPEDENALITAARAGNHDSVKLLVSRGANVNARVWANGREWRTPLNMARRGGYDDIVRTLIAAGARE